MSLRFMPCDPGSSPRMRGTLAGTIPVDAVHGIIPAYAGNTCRNDTRGCCTWDHPRVCGEHGTTLGSKRLKRGSSPRMRGTPEKDMEPYQTGGIIPAYAGNTFSATPTPTSTGDHPRACGEHVVVELVPCVSLGSSPRMWGTHHTRPVRGRGTGIIPAYAGNTTLALLRDVWVLNHPRVCGEHQMYGSLVGWDSGSSPRMRGTLIGCAGRIPSHGIIPAYAGNTQVVSKARCNVRDHPRVCGEHLRVSRIVFRELGSSPRMRGTPSGVVGFVYKAGIIPAYAGNTFSRFLGMPDGWDHPRVCGEHRLFSIRFLSYRGSSPRMRGTLYEVAADFLGSGIIPAYAGNTKDYREHTPHVRDHPRVCGEHMASQLKFALCSGSSPRMRGTHCQHFNQLHILGIIPAYAGNTSTSAR